MPLPNFIVIGAGRCGTTSLHHRLRQHPQIYMSPEKSPNFFIPHRDISFGDVPALRDMSRYWVSTQSDYEALFANVKDEIAIGEVSPIYLQTRRSPELIHDVCPDAKIIAILRHPVDRAYAHYLGRRRDGLEPRSSFSHVVESELSNQFPDEVAFGHYLGCGRYYHYLQGFFGLFPSKNIKVYLYDELIASPQGLMSDLYEFLGVDSSFVPDFTRRNRSGYIANPITRYLWVHTVRVRTFLRPYLPLHLRDKVFDLFGGDLVRPELDPGLRNRLLEPFAEDLIHLDQLLDRDLSHWRTPTPA